MNRQVRDEPSIGSVDMSDIEFRRPRARSPRADDDHRYAGLWWRISLGVFIGALAHSLVVGIYVRWELQQLADYWEAEAGKAERDLGETLRRLAPVAPPAARRPPVRTRAAGNRPLAADERCVDGKRFRAVENGWVQILEPCR